MEGLSRLGIDLWSLLLYAVNFGLVVWLVARYLTKPFLAMLDERRHKIKSNIEEAEVLREEMVRQREKMEQDKKEMMAKLADELTKSRHEIEKKRQEADAQIEAKRQQMLQEVREIIDAEKAKMVKNTEAQVLQLMQKIILYIVSNQIPEEVVRNSVSDAWKKYSKTGS